MSEITEQIEGIRLGKSDFDAAWSHFQSRLAPFARRLIRGSLASQLGASDVMSSAFLKAIKAIRKHQLPHVNRHAFASLLTSMIRTTVTDARRRQGSQKHGAGKVVPLASGMDVAAETLTPVEQSLVNEAIEQAVAWTNESIEQIPNPLARLATSLFIMEGMSGPDVSSFLQQQFPGEIIPDVRQIQRLGARVRESVAARFREESRSPGAGKNLKTV